MAHYVYVLLSLKDHNLYTGYTTDIRNRVHVHANGEVQSTKNRRPLELIYCEFCLNKDDAIHREKYLKTTWGKRYLKNRLKQFFTQRAMLPKNI